MELKSLDDDRNTLKIEELKVKPSLISLLPFMATKKVSFSAKLLGGEASGTIGMGATSYVVDVSLENLALDKSKLITGQLPVQISGATVDADIDMTVDSADAKKTAGNAKLKITKFQLPQQSVFGFNLPKVSVAEAKADIVVADGKGTIRSFDVGKDIKSDDLVAKLTGDATIDTSRKFYNPMEAVKLNVTANFEISAALKASFPFLDAILAAGKQSDGKYRYRLGGTLALPAPTPGG
jgi:type II secretion system protein N